MTKANESELAPFLMQEDKYIVCIRPRLGDYDNTYYESNRVADLPECAYQVFILECTLQEVEEMELFQKLVKWHQKTKHITMNDTHYYIEQIPDIYTQSTFYVSGLLFEQVPGRYYLPLLEGEYGVYSKEGEQWINMRTNGTLNVYSHKNIAV